MVLDYCAVPYRVYEWMLYLNKGSILLHLHVVTFSTRNIRFIHCREDKSQTELYCQCFVQVRDERKLSLILIRCLLPLEYLTNIRPCVLALHSPACSSPEQSVESKFDIDILAGSGSPSSKAYVLSMYGTSTASQRDRTANLRRHDFIHTCFDAAFLSLGRYVYSIGHRFPKLCECHNQTHHHHGKRWRLSRFVLLGGACA